MARTTFQLPVLRRVKLRGFTLYAKRSEVDLSLSDGVLCLVGANGIGKSTLISAINFGLCGRLPDPDQSFMSSGEYFQSVRPFSRSFFEGRISELDREKAEIEIDFLINDDHFHIVRSAFEPDELRFASLNGTSLQDSSEQHSPAGLNDLYKQAISNAVGLPSFEQFVFLQFFVFTFDERRHLTFWEPAVQRQILLLAFGEDPDEAQEAENLRRSIERLDSKARNANYQATETRKRVEAAQELLSGIDPDLVDLHTEHERLDQRLDDLIEMENDGLGKLSDSALRVTHLQSESLALRDRIDDVFTSRRARAADLHTRPIIAESIVSGTCQLCGATGPSAIDGVQERAAATECPLCGITLPARDEASGDAMKEIADLDSRLAQLTDDIQEEKQKQERFQLELRDIRASITSQQEALAEFERGNALVSTLPGISDLAELRDFVEANQRVIRDLNEVKLAARSERDEAMARLKAIQIRVAQTYAVHEEEFLQTFKRYAEAFLGLDIDIRFDSRRTDMFLVLDIDGKSRREHFQLSESQRFFVDIALRMAVATFFASTQTGILLVDTPEGSLDIAYETRAGQMFAGFIRSGFQMVMTANINTSQLLKQLALLCGSELMQIERMTEWAVLSEVQEQSRQLFSDAYNDLEELLHGSG